jgi:hypothetical protein
MFDLRPLRQLDIRALMRDLTANPLLAALFLISPPDALNYMGFRVIAMLFEYLRPTTQSDIARVQLQIQARYRRTQCPNLSARSARRGVAQGVVGAIAAVQLQGWGWPRPFDRWLSASGGEDSPQANRYTRLDRS